MKKRFILKISGSLALLFFTGCSDSPQWDTLRGNNEFARGNLQEANLLYLKAYEKTPFKDVIHYNLGNVYQAAGEAELACEEWDLIDTESDSEILFRAAFNRGVLKFQSGQYKQAAESFKQALGWKPSHRGAKINLELSLQKRGGFHAGGSGTQRSAGSRGESAQQRDINRVMDYVRRQEKRVWESTPLEETRSEENDW